MSEVPLSGNSNPRRPISQFNLRLTRSEAFSGRFWELSEGTLWEFAVFEECWHACHAAHTAGVNWSLGTAAHFCEEFVLKCLGAGVANKVLDMMPSPRLRFRAKKNTLKGFEDLYLEAKARIWL